MGFLIELLDGYDQIALRCSAAIAQVGTCRQQLGAGVRCGPVRLLIGSLALGFRR